MKPTLRVVMALVQTGSRLASGDCGTNTSVLAPPPTEGAASAGPARDAAADAAAPCNRLRRFILAFDPPDLIRGRSRPAGYSLNSLRQASAPLSAGAAPKSDIGETGKVGPASRPSGGRPNRIRSRLAPQ